MIKFRAWDKVTSSYRKVLEEVTDDWEKANEIFHEAMSEAIGSFLVGDGKSNDGEIFESSEKTQEWLWYDDNTDSFLSGIWIGYEVEKEKKYRIPMPQVTNGRGNNLYLSIHKDILRIAGLQNTDSWTQSFTAEEADNLPEPYNSPDIFPRVEVKEDEP